ncbi:hypothetical protein BDU57DRAFT_187309 [Ampelomyces quisqualis]|uniref:Uncharacterized protein n=1 Tax=Ampelomyces quisqualis TaxID=50730 RepID=A0A6A5QTC9_AMPQU|nr:hypothetical protein BDU57DRAFT_187309 [Ampelomyces quisqualis]
MHFCSASLVMLDYRYFLLWTFVSCLVFAEHYRTEGVLRGCLLRCAWIVCRASGNVGLDVCRVCWLRCACGEFAWWREGAWTRGIGTWLGFADGRYGRGRARMR